MKSSVTIKCIVQSVTKAKLSYGIESCILSQLKLGRIQYFFYKILKTYIKRLTPFMISCSFVLVRTLNAEINPPYQFLNQINGNGKNL